MTLGLILMGSFSTAAFLLMQGMSWGMVALGYLAGGWMGLALGLLLFCLLPKLTGMRPCGMAFDLPDRQSQY